MKIALRKAPPTGATPVQRFTCGVISARLVSAYSHGAVVIGETLYHITATQGFNKLGPGEWSPEKWTLIDVGGDDVQAQAIFNSASTPPAGRIRSWVFRLFKGYDWISLMAFAGVKINIIWLTYCFELCWYMRTGQRPTFRVTPEMLLALALENASEVARG
ncbi:MAG: hypothetical protein ACRCWC_15465 [Plesiomonas shigelloides]